MIKKSKIASLIRRGTAVLRCLPDFIIIGAQKGGTSSMAFYLNQHPQIKFSTVKEIHFFDNNFSRNLNWYKSYFPINNKKYREFITGEATPNYLFHPHCPERIKKTLPQVKLIVLLRNPIERAFSHYQMQVRNGYEDKKSFQEAVQVETIRIKMEMEKVLKDKNYTNFNLQRFSYLERGKYFKQINRWLKYFDYDQFLFLKSEDFFTDPLITMNLIYDFLQIEHINPTNLSIQNQGHSVQLDQETKEKLVQFFHDDSVKLSKLTGINFNWF
jgi:hypothetical protein